MHITDGEFMAVRVGNQRVADLTAAANHEINTANATIRAQRKVIAELRAANAALAARLAIYDAV